MIDNIKPAPYNPRKINNEQFEELKKSINEVGFIIPIIVNKGNNIIIAGHQRTRAAKALGVETVPAFFVDNVKPGNEIRFNQLHNYSDIKEKSYLHVDLSGREYGFMKITPDFHNTQETDASVIKQMGKLILQHGNVFCTVVCDGEVLLHSEYLRCCKLLGINANVYNLHPSKKSAALHYFAQSYGSYNYDNIKRNTYVQGLAQMNRSVEDRRGKVNNHSTLYRTMVLPYVKKHGNDTILDFGCGKGAYIESLAKAHNALGVEFYNHNGKAINITKGNMQIDALIKYLHNRKDFDIVVCDSVLNSVDSQQAESAVMDVLNIFAKDKLFISGRKERKPLKTADTNFTTSAYFLDENGFSANYRSGNWFFQKFHSKEQIYKLLSEHGFEIERLVFGAETSTSWQVEAHKVKGVPQEQAIKALQFEFDLPLPNGRSYKRDKDVLKALGYDY